MANQFTVVTIVGTRPELIRLSRTIALLDQHVNHILVHTGQNYDFELNEIFFRDLEIRKPDHFLNVDTSSLGKVIGDTIAKSEEILAQLQPDALLILGDTNSALSAIIAKRLKIPIFHMEAGNRSFDLNVPEEINRKIVDHISDFNLVYTEHARRHLISEGISHRRIYLTGSPLFEVLEHFKGRFPESGILSELKLQKNGYFLVSTHREENVDRPENLRRIVTILNSLNEKYGLPVIVSTHPRTRNRLEKLEGLAINSDVHFLKPFGYHDYVWLQMNAKCTISDSGTISEESAILNFPAVSIRNSMERPEAQDFGRIILTGFDEEVIFKSIEITLDEFSRGLHHEIPEEYKVNNASWRVLKLIAGNARLSNRWDNIQKNG